MSEFGLNIVSAALFKLAEEGEISIEEAKILKCLTESGKMKLFSIAQRIGLNSGEIYRPLANLLERKIVAEENDSYFVEGVWEVMGKLLLLTEEKQKTEAIILEATARE
ncbi:MAG: hypothetical protein ABID38_02350 [Candidatus Diapherotrites archaeon]